MKTKPSKLRIVLSISVVVITIYSMGRFLLDGQAVVAIMAMGLGTVTVLLMWAIEKFFDYIESKVL